MNRFVITQRDQKKLVRQWESWYNDWQRYSTLDFRQFSSNSQSELSSDAIVPKDYGMYVLLGNMGQLWFMEPFHHYMHPMHLENTASHPQDDSDHNLNLNNTTTVFRWCDPTGFWEWGRASGVRKIPVAIPWANYHCWYLGRGGLGRAVVLANDYLMVIDATYGLENGGALKI